MRLLLNPLPGHPISYSVLRTDPTLKMAHLLIRTGERYSQMDTPVKMPNHWPRCFVSPFNKVNVKLTDCHHLSVNELLFGKQY